MILHRKLTKYTTFIIPFGLGEFATNCTLYFDYYFLGFKFKTEKIVVTLSMYQDLKIWFEHWDNHIKNETKLPIKEQITQRRWV